MNINKAIVYYVYLCITCDKTSYVLDICVYKHLLSYRNSCLNLK